MYVHFKLKSFYKNRFLCHAGITKRSYPYKLESKFYFSSKRFDMKFVYNLLNEIEMFLFYFDNTCITKSK